MAYNLLSMPNDFKSPANEKWFSVMRDYFLGFIRQDELPAHLSFPQTADDVPERDEKLEEILGDVMWPKDKQDWHVLHPGRRKFIWDHKTFLEASNNRSPFQIASEFNNTNAVYKQNNIWDLRIFEEAGLIRINKALIARTIQPVAIVDSKFTKCFQTTEPTVFIIPDYPSDYQLFTTLPAIHQFNHEGVGFSAEFSPIQLTEEFRTQTGIEAQSALAMVGIKTKFDYTKKISSRLVDQSYLQGICA